MENRDVAVFIDFENIYISVRNKYDADPNFESIMDKCKDYGRVIFARAYADWYRYPRVTSALYANTIEPIYVPTYYYDREDSQSSKAIKNSVDIHLCIDAMKTLYSHPNIATYILATGDRDLIPLVNSIRQHGKRVVVIGVGGASSSHLVQSADEFVLYGQLIDKEVIEPSKDLYKALVEAIHLARNRGKVCTLASLKLLMVEIMGGFDEQDYKDPQGRPFTKFKDFVKEGERRGLVQIFTSGTVNEVFLPGEDPYKLSHFVSKPPSEEEKEETAEEEEVPIGSHEWQTFRDAMEQFDEPVLFVQIYNSLRGLRNREVIDLSNAQIREMIKQAIKDGLLVRTSRGIHNYYQLNPEHSLPG
jgi:uncharacterized protein (TIGR00288 family)